MSKKLNDLLQELNLMAEAIPLHTETLSAVGVTGETAEELKALKDELAKLDSDQEKLKSELKLKTEKLQAKQKEAVARYGELKKLIKIKMEKGSWKAFGIEDQR